MYNLFFYISNYCYWTVCEKWNFSLLVLFNMVSKRHLRISWSSLVVQQVKELALSLQWLGSLLWRRFDSWPGNSHMLGWGAVFPFKRWHKPSVSTNMPWSCLLEFSERNLISLPHTVLQLFHLYNFTLFFPFQVKHTQILICFPVFTTPIFFH